MQKLKGYKTVAFNLIMGCIVFLQQSGGDAVDVAATQAALISIQDAVLAIWAAGNIVLRAVTNTAIFKSE